MEAPVLVIRSVEDKDPSFIFSNNCFYTPLTIFSTQEINSTMSFFSDYNVFININVFFKQFITLLKKSGLTASNRARPKYSRLRFNFTITNPLLTSALCNKFVTLILSTGILQNNFPVSLLCFQILLANYTLLTQLILPDKALNFLGISYDKFYNIK